jgi:hypothetical protein
MLTFRDSRSRILREFRIRKSLFSRVLLRVALFGWVSLLSVTICAC